MRKRFWTAALFLLGLGLGHAGAARQTVPLDGTWQVAEGFAASGPGDFNHTAPVPGLLDSAQPPFPGVGLKSPLRDAYWYQRTFHLDGPVPDVALIRVEQAFYGTQVTLNGQVIGEHAPCFTAGCFDAHPALHTGDNEIVIRIGAGIESLPKGVVTGHDGERKFNLPGLFGSVSLILSGSPHLTRVQVVPRIEDGTALVHVWLHGVGASGSEVLNFSIAEAKSGRVQGTAQCVVPAGTGPDREAEVAIPIRDCHLWSPDDPFLYQLKVEGGADALETRFGMRSFHFDPATGHAVLNGKTFFMRGSNVCIYRFAEDPKRGDKITNEAWIRHLFQVFHTMHWNCLRYCIGFPPEIWYRIADEEGILIEDEFPYWEPYKVVIGHEELAREYTEWMQERWNHPCVVIWCAQNESIGPETGLAIQAVRGLDLSHRPWDNGWGAAQEPGDSDTRHLYLMHDLKMNLEDLPKVFGEGDFWRLPSCGNPLVKTVHHPAIINEYGWLWLNRDGTPTRLSKGYYDRVLGPRATPAEYRYLDAHILAAKTEFWRSYRHLAVLMHFCGLGYSRPDGFTCDNFTDIDRLTLEPNFQKLVGDAFAPVGLMIDFWDSPWPAGQSRPITVAAIDDLYQDWSGQVRFRVLQNGRAVWESTQPLQVAALGRSTVSFTPVVPKQAGKYQFEATLLSDQTTDAPVRSLRDFAVVGP